MKEDTPERPPSLDRRSFLTTALATIAGASAGFSLGRPFQSGSGKEEARFAFGHGKEFNYDDDLRAFPDCPVTVECLLPKLRAGTRVEASLIVQTPREKRELDLGAFSVFRGRVWIPTRLIYPYNDRVPGEYTYHMLLSSGDHKWMTEAPASYSVRPFYWFS